MSTHNQEARVCIQSGQAALGIELGSTRIKAVLIGADYAPLATGAHDWENQFEDGVWTYSLEAVHQGLQAAYAHLKQEVQRLYGLPLTKLSAIGVSAMMHGYLPFDGQGKLLAPFRTWRNTITGEAADKLTALFSFNIPQRWSIAHLYQAILNGEPHVPDIRFLTTLSGYVHWQLTGQKVLGIGDAVGMMPIDDNTKQYDAAMVDKFQHLVANKGYPWKLSEILPQVLLAGQDAGRLTQEGVRMLDPTGELESGIPLCPPEGDAGTGMTATNSVAERTGNVSAGTSIFLMAVLERALSRVHTELDMVTTPSGRPVAMVHCNNCTTDLNKWVELFAQFTQAAGLSLDKGRIYEAFFTQALQGDADAGNLLSYGYYSGEHITGFAEGRPLLTWSAESNLSFANLARAILFASLGTLRIGVDILEEENVHLDRLLGHGGLYRTGDTGQRFTAAALHAPVSVMTTASEGGAWGAALLAAYLKEAGHMPLEQFLEEKVFAGMDSITLQPDLRDVQGFARFMDRFRRGLAIERAAVEHS
jgi:sugar (pentulose or hexulose) kinase